jgi:hypothetical protein
MQRMAAIPGERGALRGGERGQATIEWVGLLLAVGLALGALVVGARGASREGTGGRELGQALAERITCGARAVSAAGAVPARCGPAGAGAPRGPRGLPAPPGVPPSTRRALPRRPRTGSRLERIGTRAARLAEGGWLLCMGYETYRYDLEHPRTPRELRPIGATLDIVGDCLKPWALLFG